MTGEALFLGTGASMGVPVIGCNCSVCISSSPFNKRLRPSILLLIEGRQYLVDVGPDFRFQALKYDITHLDGVILTHSHYDHIGGLDELRIYYYRNQKPVPCLASPETLEEIKVRYHYVLTQGKFNFQLTERDQGEMVFEGLDLKYFSYFQKEMKVMGLRLKDFAYVVDILSYEEDIFAALEGVKTLVIDGLAWERTSAHLGICEVIEFAKKVGCERTYLTHVAHETDHEAMNEKLPQGMNMAYDGLKLKLW